MEADGRTEADGGAALGKDDLDGAIGDALETLDVDHLQDVGRLAHERDSEKYPYAHLTELTAANYVAGNPLYDILHDGRTVFDGPPLMSLKSLSRVYPVDGTAVTEWHVDMPALTTAGYCFGTAQLTVFDGALPNLQNTIYMFWRGGLTSWDVELPSLTNGDSMFRETELTEWHIDLPNLTNGRGMLYCALNLRSFKGDLSRLQNGSTMFLGTGLTSFETTNLDRLENGNMMFCFLSNNTHRFAVKEFRYDLPSLTSGDNMFGGALTQTFAGSLPRLENGKDMFSSSYLRAFDSALPSLTNGNNMFKGCKLDLPSVQTIARTIKDNNSMATQPTLTLGIVKTIQGQVEDELALIRAKGWALTAQYN